MAVASVAAVAMASCSGVDNDRFVILHTNDMHSQIDPSADGTGGMLRQKVVVDSVKSCVASYSRVLRVISRSANTLSSFTVS